MEDILGKIMKDASSTKHAAVKQSCLESQELLANQHGLMRSPPYELRQKCLDTFHLALESKHGKLINHALSGFQRMIWDKSFQSVFESDKEEHWFPLQLMRAVQPFSTHSDDIQVEILKILLNMTCTHGQSLTATSITMLISICLEAYGNGNFAVRTAAQATVNQTLTSFCVMLQETDPGAEDQIDDSDAENDFNPLESLVEELYPVLHFTCEKLKDNKTVTRKPVGALLLQCVLSVLKNIKIDIYESSEFINFLWQELCPLLVALLGSPKTDKNIVSSQKSCEGTEIGRGSGCLAAAPSCQSMEAKTIYSIAIELVRLTGCIGSLRPVLESLFHRMLLYLPIQHRLEALKAVKELFSKPELLLELAAPPLHATSDKDWISLDLDLIKICIDSLGECCHSSDNNVCYASVSCVSSLLKSLEEINNGEKIKEEFVISINSQFRTLESSDYKGAKSERWLKTKLRNLITDQEKRGLRSKADKVDVINGSKNSIEVKHEDNVIKSSPASSDEEDSSCEFDKPMKSNESLENEKKNSDTEEQKQIEEDRELENDEKFKTENMNVENLNETQEEMENIFSELSVENTVQERSIDFQLDVKNDEIPPKLSCAEEIVSPVTESAEDALKYVSSTSSEATIDDIDEEVDIDPEEELDRLRKIPKTLLGEEDAGKEERERIENLCRARLEFAIQERQNARRFVKVFQSFLPELLSIRSSIEADQALQEFSSKYCEGLWQSQQTMKETTDNNVMSHITILNADGIYLALYSALLLNLKLIRKNYYRDPSCDVPLTEEQFIEEVHGSGVLVYLSAVWLAELYQQVLATNLLEEAGYKPVSLENYALVNLLSGLLFGTDAWWIQNVSDVDGLGNSFPGAQQLADYRRLERAIVNTQSTPNVDAGRKFNRRILTCCWETMLEVLSVLLNGTNSCGISSTIGFLLGTEGAKEEHRRTKDAIAESLDGLQRAAKLCNILGLQSNCSAVFSQLAIASCPLSEDIIFPKLSKLEYHQHFKKSLIPGRSKSLRLHASQILSMDVILSRGLELGSHSPDCWKYVFQCCLFVIQLENTYFSGHGNIQSVVSRSVLQTMNQSNSFEPSSSGNNYLDLSCMPGSSVPPKLDVNDIINPNRSFAHTSDVIKDHQLLEAIEALSQQVDRLFEEAASRLNLSALISFLVELCAASQVQLFTQNYSRFASSSGHGSNLLLYHLGDVMLRCARGGRPLIHVMKSWSVVAPHFVEAACHKDSMISKKGVTTIHDIVSALLSSNSELSHFHFNEALFKPFENLLCLELCDTDIQEQIVSSICEFVEGCCTEIRSGWRPLFGALRAVRIPSISADINESGIEKEHIHHLRVVLDVFEAFLRTDNVFVFAYAAVDCLLCLLKHVKGPAELQDTSEMDCNARNVPLDMCLAALKYLEKCCAILSSMYTIPTCPVFNSANRIQLHSEPNLVDPTIPEMEIIYFKDPEDESDVSENFNEGTWNDDHMELKEINEILKNSEPSVSLQSLEKHTGIIHVWFLLLEGLAGSLATCPKQYQSHTMESLFNMLRNLKEIPGPEFGIYCVNHLLLPMLQNWLRRTTKIYRGWENFATNFKQCCGLATDLIVDYIQNLSELSTDLLSKRSGAYMMIQQLFLVLTECIAQPMEVISRLGCACIRHMIMSAGKYFTPEIWSIICINLKRCCSVSLHDIKQLMASFHSDSDNFYGDIGEVKVAARKDTTVQESERLKQISHQVFLLDCQQSSIQSSASVYTEDDERTYTFLLFPPNHQQDDPDSSVIRVPFCSLVVGLLSHQILLQTLGSLLLQGTKYMLPTLMTLLPSENSLDLPNEEKKPGFLSKLSSEQLEILFKCLEDSYETACAFDTRPGLKFLVQKVAQTNVAANLYKQAGVSWSIHMVVLFELCISSSTINLDYVKSCISYDATKEFDNETSCPTTHESPEHNLEKDNKDLNKVSEKLLNVFLLLRDKFKEVCETYTEYTIDKDGLSSIVDRMSDQPIFFLATPADELSDFIFPTKSNDSQPVVNKEKFEPCYDSSDSEDAYVGNEEQSKDKIYTIANKQTVNSLINEYKKRKNQHSMPSRLKERLSKRNSDGSKRRTSSNNSVPEEIVNQRRNSIMKDGEAHLQVFKQLIQSFLDLHQSLTDEQFQAFLPIFFPGVQFLVAYTSDGELRLSISEWLQRLAVCCNFYVSSKPSH